MRHCWLRSGMSRGVLARLVGDEVGVGQGRARDHGDGAVPREPPLRPGPLVRVPVRRHHRVPHHLPRPAPHRRRQPDRVRRVGTAGAGRGTPPCPARPNANLSRPALHAPPTSAQISCRSKSPSRYRGVAPTGNRPNALFRCVRADNCHGGGGCWHPRCVSHDSNILVAAAQHIAARAPSSQHGHAAHLQGDGIPDNLVQHVLIA